MSLYVDIRINNEVIKTYYAHCIGIDKDNVGEYEIGEYINNKLTPPTRKIHHNRDDGAGVLSRKVLNLLVRK